MDEQFEPTLSVDEKEGKIILASLKSSIGPLPAEATAKEELEWHRAQALAIRIENTFKRRTRKAKVTE